MVYIAKPTIVQDYEPLTIFLTCYWLVPLWKIHDCLNLVYKGAGFVSQHNCVQDRRLIKKKNNAVKETIFEDKIPKNFTGCRSVLQGERRRSLHGISKPSNNATKWRLRAEAQKYADGSGDTGRASAIRQFDNEGSDYVAEPRGAIHDQNTLQM
jgi:hypothetical protein